MPRFCTFLLAFAVLPANATSHRPSYAHHEAGLRVYEAGRYVQLNHARLEATERSVVVEGHQPWRTEPLEVARIATTPFFADKTTPLFPAKSTGLAIEGSIGGHQQVVVEANLVTLERPNTPARYLVTLQRPLGKVWWVTHIGKQRPRKARR